MEQALAYRRRIFLITGVPGVLLVFGAGPLAETLGQNQETDLITLIMLVVMVLDSLVLARLFLSSSSLEKARARLSERGGDASLAAVGKVASVIAASLAMTPLLLGFVLLVLSGETWRLYLFAAISLLAGMYFWRRVEEGLRQLGGF